MIKRHKKFFNLACDLARTSSHHNYLLGAVIVKRHDILSIGVNQNFKHPAMMLMQYKTYCNLHAEAAALINAMNKRLSVKGATMYIGRVRKVGDLGISLPCATCLNLIIKSGIKRIVFFDGKEIVDEKIT